MALLAGQLHYAETLINMTITYWTLRRYVTLYNNIPNAETLISIQTPFICQLTYERVYCLGLDYCTVKLPYNGPLFLYHGLISNSRLENSIGRINRYFLYNGLSL